MLNLLDRTIKGIFILLLIAALCAGVGHMVDHQRQPQSTVHYHLSMATITADDATGNSGGIAGFPLNNGLHSGPFYGCTYYIPAYQQGMETSPPLSFLCELLC